jgi:anti-anti-sigma factor
MVRSEEHHGAGVLSVEGNLTGEAAAALRQAAERLLERQRLTDIVVDLEKSPQLDSQGLEALLWLRRRCNAAAGQLTLAGADATVVKILEITRLEHRFPRAVDVPTALKMR